MKLSKFVLYLALFFSELSLIEESILWLVVSLSVRGPAWLSVHLVMAEAGSLLTVKRREDPSPPLPSLLLPFWILTDNHLINSNIGL